MRGIKPNHLWIFSVFIGLIFRCKYSLIKVFIGYRNILQKGALQQQNEQQRFLRQQLQQQKRQQQLQQQKLRQQIKRLQQGIK